MENRPLQIGDIVEVLIQPLSEDDDTVPARLIAPVDRSDGYRGGTWWTVEVLSTGERVNRHLMPPIDEAERIELEKFYNDNIRRAAY